MFLKRRTSVFGLTIWCLVSAWVFFGCLELIEESHIIPAIAEDPQKGQDLDEAALAQLASGLKSNLSALGPLSATSSSTLALQAAVSPFVTAVYRFTRVVRHDPPSLPLYQQLSVYRI